MKRQIGRRWQWMAGILAGAMIALAAHAEIDLPVRPPARDPMPGLQPPPPQDTPRTNAAPSPTRLPTPTNEVLRVLTLTVELRDGSRIVGEPSTKTVPMRSAFGQVMVDLNNVESFQFPEDKGQVTLVFRNNDRVTGKLEIESFELKTCFGPVKLPLAVVRRGQVSPAGKSRLGLVLYYPFDQDDNSVARDRSGLGHDGKLVGPQWVPAGKKGGGCFNAQPTGEISVGRPEALQLQTFTLAAWVKRSQVNTLSGGGYPGHFFCFRDRGYVFGAHSDGRLYAIGPDKEREKRALDVRIADTQWHHLALAKSADKLVFFLDGDACGEFVMDRDQQYDCDAGLSLFSIGSNTGYPFFGTMDEIMIFDHPLSAAEIKQLVAEP